MLKRYLNFLFAFALLIALIAVALLYWQLDSVNGDLSDEVHEHAVTKAERDNARTFVAQREQQLATLNAHITANTHIEAQLRADLVAVQTQFFHRAQLIEKFTHENAPLRNWADEPLPAAVVCLRQRPTLSGAAAYRAWLSESRCLRTAGNSTNEQRSAAP